MASVAKPETDSNVLPLPTFEARRDYNPTDELTAKNWLNERLQRGKDAIFVEQVMVHPALAREILSHNAANRPLRPAKLRQYVKDIESDRWELNGESLTISSSGELNDGQHRLEAVIEANKAVEMLVLFGVQRDTRKTIDTGSNRRAQDYLAIEGVPYSNLTASLTRMVLAYERGNKEYLHQPNHISTVEVIDRAISDKRIQETAQMIGRVKKESMRGIFRPAIAAFAYHLFSKKNPGQAWNFLNDVMHGNAAEGSARAATRKRLQTLDVTKLSSRIEIIIRGWNAERESVSNPALPLLSTLPKVR